MLRRNQANRDEAAYFLHYIVASSVSYKSRLVRQNFKSVSIASRARATLCKVASDGRKQLILRCIKNIRSVCHYMSS